MISPTVGRVIWFTPPPADRLIGLTHQPWPALVTYVHGDRMINIAGFNSNGTPFSRTSVRLLQDDEKPSYEGEPVASWMPYQVAQAATVTAPPVTSTPPPQKIDETPADLQLIQPFDLGKINPRVWLYVNLQLGEADSDKITARNRAAIRVNCGCDDDGNLQPVFGQMFEQADSVHEQARLDRINSSPRVMEVSTTPPYRTTGRSIGEAIGFLGQNKVPLIYALRAKNWAAVQEWITTNAETLAKA